MTKECTQKVYTLLVINKYVGWICTLLYFIIPKNMQEYIFEYQLVQ